MTVREDERRRLARAKGEPTPEEQHPSGERTVSDKIERESVIGGHGHGGSLDEEIR